MEVEYDYTEWHDQLREHLYYILIEVFPNKLELITELLNVNAMYIWGKALTSNSYDPNDNYETLEFDGDIVMKWAFKKYLSVTYPTLSESGYSELSSTYMSKKYQWMIPEGLDLVKFIRIAPGVEVNKKVMTDVCESFFGALEKTTDMHNGMGTATCRSMMFWIFGTAKLITINLKEMKGSAKTIVRQIFERFSKYKIGVPDAVSRRTADGKYEASLILTKEQLALLQHKGIKITSPILAQGAIGNSPSAAEGKAYEIAMNRLKSYNVTSEWAEKAKNEGDLDKMNTMYVTQFKRKLEREGYVNYSFDIIGKVGSVNDTIMQLLGVREDGRKDILAEYSYDLTRVTNDKARENLVKQWLEQS